jgi:hypothetical protein
MAFAAAMRAAHGALSEFIAATRVLIASVVCNRACSITSSNPFGRPRDCQTGLRRAVCEHALLAHSTVVHRMVLAR